MVEHWIMEAQFKGSRDAHFVLTCDGSCGNAAAYLKNLCARKRFRFCGLAPVFMPGQAAERPGQSAVLRALCPRQGVHGL